MLLALRSRRVMLHVVVIAVAARMVVMRMVLVHMLPWVMVLLSVSGVVISPWRERMERGTCGWSSCSAHTRRRSAR